MGCMLQRKAMQRGTTNMGINKCMGNKASGQPTEMRGLKVTGVSEI